MEDGEEVGEEGDVDGVEYGEAMAVEEAPSPPTQSCQPTHPNGNNKVWMLPNSPFLLLLGFLASSPPLLLLTRSGRGCCRTHPTGRTRARRAEDRAEGTPPTGSRPRGTRAGRDGKSAPRAGRRERGFGMAGIRLGTCTARSTRPTAPAAGRSAHGPPPECARRRWRVRWQLETPRSIVRSSNLAS